MTKTTDNLGALGEQAAAKYLKKKSYKILERNFKNDSGRRLGEIDIIAYDKNEKELVFVEVKTRDMSEYPDGLPEENITSSKLYKLARIANVYLKLKKLEKASYRFDAISIWLDAAAKEAKIKHIPSL